MKIAPQSNLGKWSIGLLVIVPVFFFIGMSVVTLYESAGRTILQDIILRPGVALPMLAGFISGIAAFFCGMLGITRKKERSVLVFISTIAGFLLLLWTEIVFSH